MKKIFLVIAFILYITTINAQKVALHSASGVQYFTGINGFVNAYNASTSGDTIYLPGGGFTSPTNIDKTLRIYGAGHYPDSTTATSKTYVTGNLTLQDNADGFYMEGVEITGDINTNYNTSIDNVIIKYCKMTDLNVYGNATFLAACDNFASIGNVITGTVYFSNAQNATLNNCIVQGRVLSSQGNYFYNSIFTISTTNLIIDGNNNHIENNVIINSYPAFITSSVTANQIFNNLFVNASPNYGNSPTVSGNYTGIAQNTIFVNQSGYAFDYSHDYHLQAPETYLGTDASQVGIYGGSFVYKDGAVPSNPHIQLKIIDPTTNAQGQLNIKIKAAAQDN